MSAATLGSVAHDARPVVPSAVIGTAVFLFTEVMLFCGLISAYLVLRQQAPMWPPFDQPRLPVAVTAVNTAVLLASGLAVSRARSAGRDRDDEVGPEARRWLGVALGLGAVFVAVQGFEWTRLVAHGLTLSSSVYGGCFYTIIGAHALHVVAAIAVLAWARRSVRTDGGLRALRMYWWFVVGIWPVLYAAVYLW